MSSTGRIDSAGCVLLPQSRLVHRVAPPRVGVSSSSLKDNPTTTLCRRARHWSLIPTSQTTLVGIASLIRPHTPFIALIAFDTPHRIDTRIHSTRSLHPAQLGSIPLDANRAQRGVSPPYRSPALPLAFIHPFQSHSRPACQRHMQRARVSGFRIQQRDG